jgi:hypothetical protein
MLQEAARRPTSTAFSLGELTIHTPARKAFMGKEVVELSPAIQNVL